jgi:phosphonate transport system substrate-binding protein
MKPPLASLVSIFALLLVGAIAPPAGGGEPVAPKSVEPIRFAFSSRMFSDVNENDAKASVKAWGLALARERNVPMNTEPIIVSGVAELARALRSASIDGAAVVSEEFLGLDPELQGTNFFISSIAGSYTEVYLLLASAKSGVTNLGGLAGRSLAIFDNPRASLAPLWLDLLTAEQGLGEPEKHFGQIVKARKLAKVVLPVFFGEKDACVVTRRGFDTMCELNPQVRAQLRVLAASPELVPAVGFMRRGYNSPLRGILMSGLRGLEKSPAGTQVLTLFQCDRLDESSEAPLRSARELVAAHRLLSQSGAGETARSSPPLGGSPARTKSEVQ